MRSVLVMVISAVGLSVACALLASPIAPPWKLNENEIRQLIAELGSDEFAVRQQASDRLVRAGPSVWPTLREAAQKATPVETRRRLRAILGLDDSRELQQFDHAIREVIDAEAERCISEPKPETMARAALRGLYRHAGEAIPPPIVAAMKSEVWTAEQQRDALQWSYRWLASRRPLDGRRSIEATAAEVIREADPYGELLDPARRPGWQDRWVTTMGIGVRLDSDPATGCLRVVTPLPNSPARRAGLQRGDLIEQIILYPEEASKDAQPHSLSTKGMTLADASSRLTGALETEVGVVVKRPGQRGPRTIRIPRMPTPPEAFHGWRRKRDDSWDCWIDPAQRIGYVRIVSMGQQAARSLHLELRSLQSNGLRGMILDLRGNPGGVLKTAVDIATFFVGDRPILQVQMRRGKPEVYRWTGKALPEFPLVCLIDRETASAAEVVAACLQDHHRAVVVGERSCGNAHIANVDEVDEMLLKCTTGCFLRPDGRKLDRIRLPGRPADEWGVTPDPGFALDLPRREYDALQQFFDNASILPVDLAAWHRLRREFRDRQLDLALAHLREQIRRPTRR
jgi:C-terminal peptidase prc